MKQLLTLLSVTLIIASCSNDSIQKVSEDSKPESSNSNLKEERPSLSIIKSNMGKLKMHDNGYSIGKKTELTELGKQLKNKDCDVIEIVWVWDCSPKYDDMPMKIVYDKTNGSLKEIYTSTNVIEDYKNINTVCLEQFLKNEEKSFYSLENYCKDAKHDFNNREMKVTAIGAKPEQSDLDGSVKIVKDYVRSNAKDASSIDFLEWSKVSYIGENWIVRCKYKGTNSLGAIVSENVWFYMQDNQVLKTKSIQ
jgi:hypothetical protein